MNVLLGDTEAPTLENHSLRSKYSACGNEKKFKTVVSLILMPHFLLSGHFHGKERKQQSI
jgi:hypothetical protein